MILKIEEGSASFEIPLELSYTAGTYTLRAHTQYQKNFDPKYIFQKQIKVLDRFSSTKELPINKDLEVKFYPEGGYLVNGLKSKLTYEINNGKKTIKTDGKIYVKDEVGNTILETTNDHGSIGLLNFTPQKNKKYFFHIILDNEDKAFELPTALDKGFTLNVNGSDDDHIYLSLDARPKRLLSEASLIGHIRGDIFIDMSFHKNSSPTLKLDRNQIPSGILQFTLFDADQNPVCERLTFNYNDSLQVNTEALLSKTSYKSREEVTIDITTRENNVITPTEFSISAYNADLFRTNDNELTIANYLLLQSDLTQPINSLNRYLDEDGVKNHYLLDLEMMTKTWRRFKWQEVLEESFHQISFGTQENLQFLGIVKEKSNSVKAKVKFFAAGADLINAETITDENGVFYFKDVDLRDQTNIFISASKYNENDEKGKKGKKPDTKNITIEYFPLDTLMINLTMPNNRADVVVSSKQKTNQVYKPMSETTIAENKLIDQVIILDSLATAEWAVDIEEILIKESKFITQTERRIEAKELYKERGWKYSNIPQMFFLEDMPGAYDTDNIFTMITSLVPKTITRPSANAEMSVAQKLPLSFRDVLMEPAAQLPGGEIVPAGSINNKYAKVPILIDYQNNIFEGEQIDPKKLYAMEIRFGKKGIISYINLISKDPLDKKKKAKQDNTININHPGYHKAREFYSPSYDDNKLPSTLKQDLRTTLYWKPDNLITDKPEKLNFYTGNRKGNYIIVIEGISKSGIPFVKKVKFAVE